MARRTPNGQRGSGEAVARWRELSLALGGMCTAVGGLLKGLNSEGWVATALLIAGVGIAVIAAALLVARYVAESRAERRDEEQSVRRSLRVPVTRVGDVDAKAIG